MIDLDSGRPFVTQNGNLTGLVTRTGLNRFVQLSELESETDPAAARRRKQQEACPCESSNTMRARRSSR
jgi:hypothetical protein